LQLGLLTFIFSIVVGVGLGISSAIKPNSVFDYFGTGVSIFCLVIPSFVFAILLQVIFSVWLGWLPTGGWSSPRHWIMPVLANSLAPILVLQRYTQSSMTDAMKANYVRTARAKGLSRRRIMFVHVFKNALTPLLTVGGPLAAGLIVGSFFVESIFRIPGIGFYFVSAIGSRDYPMIMATTLIWTLIISLAYLITDLLYALADPRVTLMKEE
jgi:ABC-type dipeptide/oligopeptide/nickel transport system permease component